MSSISSPAPYVVSGTWFPCKFKGIPRAKLADVSIVSNPKLQKPDVDVSNLEDDPHRNERVVQSVLRAHLISNASKFPPNPECILQDWKPKVATFNDKGVCEISVCIEKPGGPIALKATDDVGRECVSMPFAVCSEKIILTSTLQDWERQLEQGNGSWPLSWLKDMGKKDKTVTVSVALNGPAPASPMPLGCILAYADGLTVPNQKLLSLRSSRLEISEQRPNCIVHFRVEDVSKNHQSKAFMVVIQSAREKDWTVAPTATYPVIVKSKINKKRRGDDEEGGRKHHKREPPPVPPELLTALSSSLAHELSQNSLERATIDKELRELLDKSKEIHDRTRALLERMDKIAEARHNLEAEFSALIAKCGFEPPPQPAKLEPSPEAASRMSSIAAAAAAGIGPLGSGLPPIHGDLILGPSTASALMFAEGDTLASSALYLPTGVMRLPSGELFSIAANTAFPQSSNFSVEQLARRMSSAPPLQGVLPGNSDDDSDEDAEKTHSVNGREPICAFVKAMPIQMASGEKRWLAFSESLKLLGFFLEDGVYVSVSSNMDSKWIKSQEKAASEGDLRRIEPVSEANALIDQVLSIMHEGHGDH